MTMKRLLPLILSALVVASCVPESGNQRVERRNWSRFVYGSPLTAERQLIGDIESLTIIEHTIDKSSGKVVPTSNIEDTFIFNKHGDVIEHKTAYEHHKYQYAYDSNGYPIAEIEEFYDSNGALSHTNNTEYINSYNSRGEFEGWRTNFSEDHEEFYYDLNGNLVSKIFYYEGISSEYVGDCEYKYNRDGRITEINDEIDRWGSTRCKYEYDSRGRIIAKQQYGSSWDGGSDHQTRILQYNSRRGLMEERTSEGKVTYKFDKRGNLVEVAYYSGNETEPSRRTEYKISYRGFRLF